MINLNHFPDIYMNCLERYYKLHWSSDYFFNRMQDGTITTSDGIQYLLIYRNCTPGMLRTCGQIQLSFRQAKKEFELCNYVLISPLIEKD